MRKTVEWELDTRVLTPTNRRWVAIHASAYMLRNIDGAISIQSLSSMLSVSQRTLRYAFGEVYGINPSQYLKSIRLLRARRSLQKANPRRTTVLREAMRSGFWHLSRFSAEYKRRFGELPSATLRA